MSPVAGQTLPECGASIGADGNDPSVRGTTQLGADTDIGVETKAEEK